MSKQGDKLASTFYGEGKRRPAKTPPKSQSHLRRTQPKSFDSKKRINDNPSFQQLAQQEKDQRFRYLIKHGELKKVEKSGNIIFAELPQIQNVWVCYRRPVERQANIEKLSLDSLQLTHLPLLEGEEKLKMLTFQHNRISKIENLISLPNLLYIDLYDNLIKQIENISLPTLKVLLLPKNQISRMKNLTDLIKLQVLDLHSNRITKIEGFGLLNSLRILNLSHNQIGRIENLEALSVLNQLNLKSNIIVVIQGLSKLYKLEKCFLANNRIQIKAFETCDLVKLSNLRELSLESNPCAKDRALLLKSIMKAMPNLKILDGTAPNQQEQSAANHDSDTQSNHQQVLKLISGQWQQQKKRIAQIEAAGGSKKQFLKSTCITGGHAEIEDENILFIYGNSYDVVLANTGFQECVEKIRFEFVFMEFLIEQQVLSMLKKFKKLKILEFRETWIMSLLQIAKLENLPHLKILIIEPAGNPIANCTFLKEFIIYRFHTIIQINREDVKEADRVKAKHMFQNFDKVLQIPEKFFGPESLRNYPSEDPQAKKDKNYIKSFNKVTGECADLIVEQCANRAEVNLETKTQLDYYLDEALLHMIAKTQSTVISHSC